MDLKNQITNFRHIFHFKIILPLFYTFQPTLPTKIQERRIRKGFNTVGWFKIQPTVNRLNRLKIFFFTVGCKVYSRLPVSNFSKLGLSKNIVIIDGLEYSVGKVGWKSIFIGIGTFYFIFWPYSCNFVIETR